MNLAFFLKIFRKMLSQEPFPDELRDENLEKFKIQEKQIEINKQIENLRSEYYNKCLERIKIGRFPIKVHISSDEYGLCGWRPIKANG